MTLLALLAALSSGPPARAADYFLATDVPATLGTTTYTPNQLLLRSGGAYALAAALPADFAAGALHRRPDGSWLISPAHPVRLGGIDFEPRDIFSWDGTTLFAMVLDGSAAGVPAGSRIDALLLGAGGEIVVSFDVPTNLAGTEYSRSDLAAYQAGIFSLSWDAEGAGVPAGSNLVGAARDSGGVLVVSFDVPTRLAGSEYLPGELAGWTGAGWFHYDSPAGWPANAQLRDFAFVPAPGGVPDGSSLPGIPLTVAAVPGGDITLNWGPACGAASDYEIYEGSVGAFYSHVPAFCSTGGSTTKTLTPGAGNRYYLVVSRNALREGPYGNAGSGAPRPPGAGACLAPEPSACP